MVEGQRLALVPSAAMTVEAFFSGSFAASLVVASAAMTSVVDRAGGEPVGRWSQACHLEHLVSPYRCCV